MLSILHFIMLIYTSSKRVIIVQIDSQHGRGKKQGMGYGVTRLCLAYALLYRCTYDGWNQVALE